MEIYKKIAKAKEQIKSSKLKKEGENKFSHYNYFTPEQVESLVFEACQTNELVTKFDLKRNEFGVLGILTIVDLHSGEKLEYEMATAIPEIKATNIAQQLGGCVTYTERYLKMSVFGIVENSLDFDDKDNSQKQESKTDDKAWLSKSQFTDAIQKIQNANFGGLSKDEWKKKLFDSFKMKNEYKDQILIELNNPLNETLNQ